MSSQKTAAGTFQSIVEACDDCDRETPHEASKRAQQVLDSIETSENEQE